MKCGLDELRYKDVIFFVIWLKLIIFAHMYKARKYRIYPNSSQKELIHKHCVNFLIENTERINNQLEK